MSEATIIFCFVYILITACIVYPPTEFTSIGLSIEQLFATFLGDERQSFIQFHLRRTSLNIFIHSLLPFGFFAIYTYQFVDDYTEDSWEAVCLLSCLKLSILAPILAATIIFYWHKDFWKEHPIAKNLSHFMNPVGNEHWASVAGNVNAEIRRPNVLIQKTNPLVTVLITDNWIIQTLPYYLRIAYQSDASLVVNKSDTHLIGVGTADLVQYVNIQVKSARLNVPEFSIRINSLDFQELQDRLSRPIAMLVNVDFHTSLVDRFVAVFREEIVLNRRYLVDNDITDSCFACMIVQPDVKIEKNCSDLNREGAPLPADECCGVCYCRPMWCQTCLAKWFVARQEESQRSEWLSKKCACPMCRTTFCIRDVCIVEKRIDN